MPLREVALLLPALLPLVLADPAAAQEEAHSSCQNVSEPKSVTHAKAALESDPSVLSARLNLADALVDAGCYQDATAVLQEGQAMHSHSSELQRKLRDVRSMLAEQSYFEGLDKAEESAKLQRDMLRCSQLSDIDACDDALRSKPDDLQVALAKGDALLQKNRPADAVSTYRHADSLTPGSEVVEARIAAAERRRQALLLRCQSGSGAEALEACDAALLRGADDEFTTDRRRGILLQSMNQPGPALDSYIAANVLKQDDKSVALAIVTLTASTGRKDALALASRGTSLLTLGHPAEAAVVLQQAKLLAPDLPGIETGLATAQGLARTKPRRAEHASDIAATRPGNSPLIQAPTRPAVVGIEPVATRTYSNDAPPAQSN
jgi:tetratricopeptide (TPR) repeat protein